MGEDCGQDGSDFLDPSTRISEDKSCRVLTRSTQDGDMPALQQPASQWKWQDDDSLSSQSLASFLGVFSETDALESSPSDVDSEAIEEISCYDDDVYNEEEFYLCPVHIGDLLDDKEQGEENSSTDEVRDLSPTGESVSTDLHNTALTRQVHNKLCHPTPTAQVNNAMSQPNAVPQGGIADQHGHDHLTLVLLSMCCVLLAAMIIFLLVAWFNTPSSSTGLEPTGAIATAMSFHDPSLSPNTHNQSVAAGVLVKHTTQASLDTAASNFKISHETSIAKVYRFVCKAPLLQSKNDIASTLPEVHFPLPLPPLATSTLRPPSHIAITSLALLVPTYESVGKSPVAAAHARINWGDHPACPIPAPSRDHHNFTTTCNVSSYANSETKQLNIAEIQVQVAMQSLAFNNSVAERSALMYTLSLSSSVMGYWYLLYWYIFKYFLAFFDYSQQSQWRKHGNKHLPGYLFYWYRFKCFLALFNTSQPRLMGRKQPQRQKHGKKHSHGKGKRSHHPSRTDNTKASPGGTEASSACATTTDASTSHHSPCTEPTKQPAPQKTEQSPNYSPVNSPALAASTMRDLQKPPSTVVSLTTILTRLLPWKKRRRDDSHTIMSPVTGLAASATRDLQTKSTVFSLTTILTHLLPWKKKRDDSRTNRNPVAGDIKIEGEEESKPSRHLYVQDPPMDASPVQKEMRRDDCLTPQIESYTSSQRDSQCSEEKPSQSISSRAVPDHSNDSVLSSVCLDHNGNIITVLQSEKNIPSSPISRLTTCDNQTKQSPDNSISGYDSLPNSLGSQTHQRPPPAEPPSRLSTSISASPPPSRPPAPASFPLSPPAPMSRSLTYYENISLTEYEHSELESDITHHDNSESEECTCTGDTLVESPTSISPSSPPSNLQVPVVNPSSPTTPTSQSPTCQEEVSRFGCDHSEVPSDTSHHDGTGSEVCTHTKTMLVESSTTASLSSTPSHLPVHAPLPLSPTEPTSQSPTGSKEGHRTDCGDTPVESPTSASPPSSPSLPQAPVTPPPSPTEHVSQCSDNTRCDSSGLQEFTYTEDRIVDATESLVEEESQSPSATGGGEAALSDSSTPNSDSNTAQGHWSSDSYEPPASYWSVRKQEWYNTMCRIVRRLRAAFLSLPSTVLLWMKGQYYSHTAVSDVRGEDRHTETEEDCDTRGLNPCNHLLVQDGSADGSLTSEQCQTEQGNHASTQEGMEQFSRCPGQSHDSYHSAQDGREHDTPRCGQNQDDYVKRECCMPGSQMGDHHQFSKDNMERETLHLGENEVEQSEQKLANSPPACGKSERCSTQSNMVQDGYHSEQGETHCESPHSSRDSLTSQWSPCDSQPGKLAVEDQVPQHNWPPSQCDPLTPAPPRVHHSHPHTWQQNTSSPSSLRDCTNFSEVDSPTRGPRPGNASSSQLVAGTTCQVKYEPTSPLVHDNTSPIQKSGNCADSELVCTCSWSHEQLHSSSTTAMKSSPADAEMKEPYLQHNPSGDKKQLASQHAIPLGSGDKQLKKKPTLEEPLSSVPQATFSPIQEQGSVCSKVLVGCKGDGDPGQADGSQDVEEGEAEPRRKNDGERISKKRKSQRYEGEGRVDGGKNMGMEGEEKEEWSNSSSAHAEVAYSDRRQEALMTVGEKEGDFLVHSVCKEQEKIKDGKASQHKMHTTNGTHMSSSPSLGEKMDQLDTELVVPAQKMHDAHNVTTPTNIKDNSVVILGAVPMSQQTEERPQDRECIKETKPGPSTATMDSGIRSKTNTGPLLGIEDSSPQHPTPMKHPPDYSTDKRPLPPSTTGSIVQLEVTIQEHKTTGRPLVPRLSAANSLFPTVSLAKPDRKDHVGHHNNQEAAASSPFHGSSEEEAAVKEETDASASGSDAVVAVEHSISLLGTSNAAVQTPDQKFTTSGLLVGSSFYPHDPMLKFSHGDNVNCLPFDGPVQFFTVLAGSAQQELCVYKEHCLQPSLLAPPPPGPAQYVPQRFFTTAGTEVSLECLDERGYN